MDLTSYRPWLNRVALGMSPTRPDWWDDLMQTGWIAMWQAGLRYDPEKANTNYGDSFDAWLKAHARWAMLSWIGQQVRVPVTVGDDIWKMLESAELFDLVEGSYHNGTLHDAIRSLTKRQREYVFARFWLGEQRPQLTARFGYSPESLWHSRRNGARWKLEKALLEGLV